MEKITNKDLVYFADFETTTENTQYYKANRDTTITLWVLKHINGMEHSIGVNLDTFMQEIEQLPNGSVVMFHNLAFDVRFIWTHLLTRNWKMVSGSFYDKVSNENPLSNVAKTRAHFPESNQFSIGGDGSKVYFMSLYYPSTNKKIEFKCSLKLLPLSIAKIGKSIGMDKHNDETLKDGFYDVEPMDDVSKYPRAYVEYAKRDVDIICEFYKIFLTFINTIQDDLKIKPELRIKGIPSTIGALSITLQERYLKSRETFGKESVDKNGNPTWRKFDTATKISGQQNDLARKFYLGGLTLFNANGLKQEWENGAYVDINSSYPYSMTKPLPYGFATTKKPQSGKNGETYLTFYHIYVKKAKIKNKQGLYPLQDWLSKLGVKPKHSYLKNNIELLYYFDCYYLDKEWELMQQFYDFDYEIKETYYLFAKPFLKEYTETLYKYKENATDKNYREFYKLLLNNGYGKYGQDRNYDVVYPAINDDDYEMRINQELVKYKNQDKHTRFYFNRLYTPKKITSGSYYDRDNLKVVKYKRVNVDAYGNPNVWIAATITSYSRMNLLQSVLKCGNDKGVVKYTDTDSMMLSDSSYTQYLDLDDSKLGKWKVEHNNCKFTITGKKMYKLEYQENGEWKELYKAKGVSKNHQKELIDKMIRDGDDDVYLIGGKRCKMQTYSGWIITDMDVVINNNPLVAGYVGVKDEK